MAEKKTEIAKIENTQSEFALALTGNFAEIVAEEMEGLGSMSFDNIKIPAGGILAFEVPSADSDEADLIKDLECVIVDHHPINTYWASEMGDDNKAPDCVAYDGKTGFKAEGGCRECATCPYNEFGSGKNGGKACKNGHRLYILRSGQIMPMILQLPPTSIKSFKNYLSKKVLMNGQRPTQVLTNISLVREENAGGIKYSCASFKKLRNLNDEEAQSVAQISATVKAMRQAMAQQPPVREDDAPGGDEFQNVPVDADGLPF